MGNYFARTTEDQDADLEEAIRRSNIVTDTISLTNSLIGSSTGEDTLFNDEDTITSENPLSERTFGDYPQGDKDFNDAILLSLIDVKFNEKHYSELEEGIRLSREHAVIVEFENRLFKNTFDNKEDDDLKEAIRLSKIDSKKEEVSVFEYRSGLTKKTFPHHGEQDNSYYLGGLTERNFFVKNIDK